jgi:hypothetical protein
MDLFRSTSYCIFTVNAKVVTVNCVFRQAVGAIPMYLVDAGQMVLCGRTERRREDNVRDFCESVHGATSATSVV